MSHWLSQATGMFVCFGVILGGCGPGKAELARLRGTVHRMRAELSERKTHSRKLRQGLSSRVARLEAELASLRRSGVASRPVVPPAHRTPQPPMHPRDARPGPVVDCPGALAGAVRKVRRRMRLARLRTLLAGVAVRRSKAVTLSGSGTRTRRVWSGTCFRITLEAGRVATVELVGVASPRPRRRRARRRRRRR